MNNTDITIQRFKRQRGDKLDLSCMNLTFIPHEVFALQGVKVLDLSDNRLIVVDEKIGNLDSLETLDLRNNNIKDLPEALKNLTSLSSLELAGNPLNERFKKLNNQQGSRLRSELKDCYKKGKSDVFDDLWDDGNAEDNDFDFDFGEEKKVTKASSRKTENREDLFEIGSKNNEDIIGIESNSSVKELKKKIKLLEEKNNKLETRLILGDGDFNHNADSGNIGDTVSLSEINIFKKISQGGYSIVEWGIFRETEIAIKKIFDPVITDALMEEISTEVRMLSRLRHPNIILMMAHSVQPPELFIVFELCKKGSLYDVMHKMKYRKYLKHREDITHHRNKIVLQIAKAIGFMHASKVVHRDLKTLNILIDDDYNAKLCDFGISKDFTELNKGSGQFVGTPSYMSPEQFQQKAYNHKVDVFAFGAILWEIFSREVPFDGIEPIDVKEKVLAGRDLEIRSSIPPQIHRVISKCRAMDPHDRPDFPEIIKELKQALN